MFWRLFLPFSLRIFGFISILFVGCFLFSLHDLFMTNPLFNGGIIAVWILGVALVMHHFIQLVHEGRLCANRKIYKSKLLAPLAHLYEKNPQALHPQVMQAFNTCQRGLGYSTLRYVSSTLIFIGLLGTLWGLSRTIILISDVIGNLPTQGMDQTFFETLKDQLRQPLSGMGVAFSSSLFGVGGSATLGFLILQLEQARATFFLKILNWLPDLFKLSSLNSISEGQESQSALAMEHTLTRWIQEVDRLNRLQNSTDHRQQECMTAIVHLNEKLHLMTDTLKHQTGVMMRWTEEQVLTRRVLEQVENQMNGSCRNEESLKEYLALLTGQMTVIVKEVSSDPTREILRQELRHLSNVLLNHLSGRQKNG